MRWVPLFRRPPVALLAGVFVAACGPGDETTEPVPDVRPECLDAINLACMPVVEPTFQKIFDNTFRPTCASGTVSCHSAGGHQGGLIFEDAVEAEALIRGTMSGDPRVKPGDARCSELVVRVDSPGHDWSMPPGAPLSEPTRCAIRLWVQSLQEP